MAPVELECLLSPKIEMTIPESARIGHYRIIRHLTEASQAAALHLTQCAATAQECDHASHSRGRQELEQVPRSVVEEEEALECDQRSDKDGVR
jgi:hypothetical protein